MGSFLPFAAPITDGSKGPKVSITQNSWNTSSGHSSAAIRRERDEKRHCWLSWRDACSGKDRPTSLRWRRELFTNCRDEFNSASTTTCISLGL